MLKNVHAPPSRCGSTSLPATLDAGSGRLSSSCSCVRCPGAGRCTETTYTEVPEPAKSIDFWNSAHDGPATNVSSCQAPAGVALVAEGGGGVTSTVARGPRCWMRQ